MNGKRTATDGKPRGSKAMATVVSRIAKARGMDLDKVGSHTRIDNPPWLALVIEVIGQNLISVCHYAEQTGDLMRDPECVYYFNTLDSSYIPVSYRNDFIGCYRGCARVVGGEIVGVVPGEQRDQATLANVWARNLKRQGFVQAAKKPASHREDES